MVGKWFSCLTNTLIPEPTAWSRLLYVRRGVTGTNGAKRSLAEMMSGNVSTAASVELY